MTDTEDSKSEGTVIEGEGEGRIIENESIDEDDGIGTAVIGKTEDE